MINVGLAVVMMLGKDGGPVVALALLEKPRHLLRSLVECKDSMWLNPHIGNSSRRYAQMAGVSDPD